MPEENPLVVDLTKRENSAQVLPSAPLLSSQQAGWNGVFFTCFRHPAHEMPEHRPTQHVLAISGVRTQVKVERRLDEQLRSYFLGNGAMAFIPAHVSHWVRWDRMGEFTILNLCPKLVERVAHESVNADRIELIPQFAVVDPFVQQIGLALKANVESGCIGGRLYGESAATMLAVHLLQNYSVCSPKLFTYSDGLPPYRLQQVTEYIDQYLAQDIKLADMAFCAGMSQYHFLHLFQQSMGITPYQYLIQQRVERAKQLLKQRDVAIADIALQCGCNSQSHLTRLFRQFTGITPKAYRER